MEKPTIENLPDEVLAEIFNFVDKSTLKKVALTCQRWNEIADTMNWSLSVNLYNIPSENRKDNFRQVTDLIVSSNRRFTKIHFENFFGRISYREPSMTQEEMLAIFKKHGSRVQELKIFCFVLDDSKILLEIFKTMPVLKKLLLYEAKLSVSEVPNEELLLFDKLETLEMVNSDYFFLQFLKKAQLTTFKLLESEEERATEPLQPLLDFLAGQKNITKLALRSIQESTSQLFKTPLEGDNIPFKLKKLSLLEFDLHQENGYDNLLKFLQLHSSTIEEVQLGDTFPATVYELVFSKFKRLRKLHVNELPTDANVYKRLETNTSVTQLFLDELIPNDINGKVFRHLPNVESLFIMCSSSTTASYVQLASANLPLLKHLKLSSIDGEISSVIRFPNLETLTIGDIFSSDIDWATLAANNPHISELHIAITHFLSNLIFITSEDIQEIANLPLRVLRIDVSEYFSADKEFFKVIRKSFNDLKSLHIKKRSLAVDISSVSDISALHLMDEKSPSTVSINCTFLTEFWNDDEYGNKLRRNFSYEESSSYSTDFDFDDSWDD